MVADRNKNSLRAKGLEHVRLRETETLLKPPEIASVLQTFEQAKGRGSAVGRRDYVPPMRQPPSVVGSPVVQLFCSVTNNLAEGPDCLLLREDLKLLTNFYPSLEAHNTAEPFAFSSGDREVGTGAISEPAAAVYEVTGETAPEAPAEEIDEAVEV
ncbi:hypothetical protein HPB48_011607 [Haemaphysalis longicornis]|uniref:Uncharacterized protein n=1 Tax=Haemaphysalis longicornis TaxID=44386 RepID=A0A9J6G7F1_HAELO|nr:hypothetical protein HPB48_011607 [Haemaphysalis longicornis]